jgi:RHS repeat-associated protein
MEKDNEIKVNGGSYDFGARIYDSRLGRWLSLDPLMKKYPGLNPYSGIGNNPIFYIDPDGQVIEPYARINMLALIFLNVVWVNYPYFTSNTNGMAFHETRHKMLNSSKIFTKINRQLIHSKNNFRYTETSTTPSGVEATMSKKDTEATGNFENNHTGKKDDPFVINFNLNTAQNISGHNSFSTIFEETFHAGQKDFYGINTPSKIDIEVEAKVSKALEGFDNGEFSQYFKGNFQDFRKDYKKGTTTPEQLNVFNKAVNDFAKDVSEVYIKHNINKGMTKENAEKNYGISSFTGKFKYAEKLYGNKLNTEKAKE